MEERYVDLKMKIRKEKIRLPRILKGFGGGEREDGVSVEDVEYELKNTIVEDDGKRYFGDIHLIRKGRDKIASSLSRVG
jgi:hypothetical protein